MHLDFRRRVPQKLLYNYDCATAAESTGLCYGLPQVLAHKGFGLWWRLDYLFT